ncbi:putative S-adenosyl-L-methionine-dependent methyltransferase [Mycolicibacterium madagascariense]|uniref:S-adenosyl-L-methionine-dependent methyltransferase n=1 Tax=Mycolicibacterium madagascariense TaxID=212765 RepID=A0A7I7XD69_9MYCO|nr:class I SAM-dependent methyltransferase [Mycolicibacterium madagascariense]MCV7014479.1 class I SAM-dependent methyltransferase [Mycolicibacterium madagascariense]BBZ26857.1 putative S-adenosyl-L-methionine-dependent methyltransferase [Mycolicibacterium madagascariense]
MTRTDDDTWDLASSVGATATAVAASRATASQGPDALLDDPWAEPLVRAVGVEAFIRMVDGESRGEDDPLLNRRAMNEQMAVRTRYFDDFFVAAGESGIRQAVILASGLDTRAYRLPWPAGTAVFEIDQPEVIAFKTRTLADLGAEPTAQRHTVSIDLREDWPTALREAGFDAGLPTAWSAEGLLVYLPPDAQDRLFDDVTALSAPGSRIATEHMNMGDLPDDWAEKLTQRSQRVGSTIDLTKLFYLGDRNSAADYLSEHGWRTEILSTAAAYAAQGFDLPDDELAGFGGDSGYLTATLT